MPLNNTFKNALLDGTAVDEQALYASLHTGAEGSGSGNEISGGSPAYARKALTWEATPSGGEIDLTADVTFDVPASTPTRVGLWDASSGGNFLGDAAISVGAFAAQGELVLKAGTKIQLADPA